MVQPAAIAALEETYARIPIEQIHPSKTNPRTHFDDTYLAELAGSIREKGVLEPILLRPLPAKKATADETFEIVAGECRYRASKLAGLTHLPAVIRFYTDEQVLEIQIEENTHRKDLTPLEEAAAYRRLITANPDKHSAATIATRIGMSVSYVWDYLSLLNLIPEAKQLLEDKRMAVGHAVVIARQKPADQARIIAPNARMLFVNLERGLEFDGDSDPKEKPGKYDDVKAVTVRELEAAIAHHIRFDMEHAAKAAPLKFEEVAREVKSLAAEPGRGKKVIAITFAHAASDDAKDPNERTYGYQSWRRADGTKKTTKANGYSSQMKDSPECEYSVMGVVVAGDEHYGETFTVCINRDKCKVHFGQEIAAREKNAKLRESGQGKKAAKNEKRQEQSWERDNRLREEARKRWELIKPQAMAAIAGKIKPGKVTDKVLADVIRNYLSNDSESELQRLLPGRVTTKNFTRAIAIVDVLDQAWSADKLRPLAKKYGVDLAKLEKDLAPKKDAAAPAKKTA